MKIEELEELKVRRLKLLIASNKLQFALLLALEELPEEKFVSKLYFIDLLKTVDEKLETRIGQTLASMAQNGAIDNHPLINYRLSDQACHDRRIARLKSSLFKSLGIMHNNDRHLDSPEALSELRRQIPVDLKREIGWLDDVKHDGIQRLIEFEQSRIVGRISLAGANLTQSVYRINPQGRKRLELFKRSAVGV